MAYQALDNILASHYNTFVAGAGTFGIINHNVANLNTVWGPGFNDKGYGQSNVLTQVTQGATVSATQWANLIARMNSAATHQATSPGSMPGNAVLTASNALVIGIKYEIVTAGTGDWTTAGAADSNPGTQFVATATTNGQADGTANQPALITNDLIQAVTTLSANVTDIYNNRLNSIATAATQTQNATTGVAGSWANTSTHVINIQFASAAQARYFFNAGGNIAITATMTGGTPAKVDPWDDGGGAGILPESATVALQAQSTTKTGGSGVLNTDYFIESAIGYYGLGVAPIEVFKQFTLGGGAYPTNHLTIEAQTNGVQGATGDNGSLVTLTVILNDDVGAGDPVDGTTTVTATVNFPETTNLTNTWGVVTFVPVPTVVEA